MAIRTYQLSIVKTALFNNTLVCLPTGLGKTFIAAVVMYNYYRWFPTGKIIFLAHTKPLVAQQVEACHYVVGIPDSDTAELQGSVSPLKRRELWKSRRVFYCTPQSFKNDLDQRSCDPSDFICVVIDEAHKATGKFAYVTCIQELFAHNKNIRILALSATPGSDNNKIQSVIDNLHISSLEVRTENDIDVKKYINEKLIEPIIVKSDNDLSIIKEEFLKLMQIPIDYLFMHKVLWERDPHRINKGIVVSCMNNFQKSPPSDIALDKVGEVYSYFGLLMKLAHYKGLFDSHGLNSFIIGLDSLKFPAIGKRMSYCQHELITKPEYDHLLNQAKSLANSSTNHPKMIKLIEIVKEHFQRMNKGNTDTRIIIFTQYRDSVSEIINAIEVLKPLVKPSEFIGQAAKNNVKGLSQKKQREVMNNFREGIFNTLVATCIGEEGLDVGEVDLIICFDVVTSPIRSVQRFGRTGRKRTGKVILLISQGPEYDNYLRSQRNAKQLMNTLKKGSSKFKFWDNERIIPSNCFPQMVEKSLDIEEYHFSQVGGHKSEKKSKSIHINNNMPNCDDLQSYLNIDPIKFPQNELQKVFIINHSTSSQTLVWMNSYINNNIADKDYQKSIIEKWYKNPPTVFGKNSILNYVDKNKKNNNNNDIINYISDEDEEIQIIPNNNQQILSSDDVILPKPKCKTIEFSDSQDNIILPKPNISLLSKIDNNVVKEKPIEKNITKEKPIEKKIKETIEIINEDTDEDEEIVIFPQKQNDSILSLLNIEKELNSIFAIEKDDEYITKLISYNKENGDNILPTPPSPTAIVSSTSSSIHQLDSEDEQFEFNPEDVISQIPDNSVVVNNENNNLIDNEKDIDIRNNKINDKDNEDNFEIIENDIINDCDLPNSVIENPINNDDIDNNNNLVNDLEVSNIQETNEIILLHNDNIQQITSSNIIKCPFCNITLLTVKDYIIHIKEYINELEKYTEKPLSNCNNELSIVNISDDSKIKINTDLSNISPIQPIKRIEPSFQTPNNVSKKIKTSSSPPNIIKSKIEEYLIKILPTLDMKNTTVKKVKLLIEENLNIKIDEYKKYLNKILKKLINNSPITLRTNKICELCHNNDKSGMYSCISCGLTVHSFCYGINTKLNENIWKCDICKNKKDPNKCICELCCKSNDVLKLSTDNNYVHIICSCWIKEIKFTNDINKIPININQILSKSKRLECEICHINKGVCIKCDNNNCNRLFHPMCGWKKGYYFKEDDDENNKIKYFCYCPNHNPCIKQITQDFVEEEPLSSQFSEIPSNETPVKRKFNKISKKLVFDSPKKIYKPSKPHSINNDYIRNFFEDEAELSGNDDDDGDDDDLNEDPTLEGFIVSELSPSENDRITNYQMINNSNSSEIDNDDDIQESDINDVIHIGIKCNNCNINPIKGARYKCTICECYNLCEDCYDKGIHGDHEFDGLDSPQDEYDDVNCENLSDSQTDVKLLSPLKNIQSDKLKDSDFIESCSLSPENKDTKILKIKKVESLEKNISNPIIQNNTPMISILHQNIDLRKNKKAIPMKQIPLPSTETVNPSLQTLWIDTKQGQTDLISKLRETKLYNLDVRVYYIY